MLTKCRCKLYEIGDPLCGCSLYDSVDESADYQSYGVVNLIDDSVVSVVYCMNTLVFMPWAVLGLLIYCPGKAAQAGHQLGSVLLHGYPGMLHSS